MAAGPALGRSSVDTFTVSSAVGAPALGSVLALRIRDGSGLGQMGLGVGSGVGIAAGLRVGTGGGGFPAVATASTTATGMALHRRYGWQIAWPFHALAGTVAFAQQRRQGLGAALTGAGVGLTTSWLSTDRFPISVTYTQRPRTGTRQLAVSVPVGR